MHRRPHILLVEDDPAIAELLRIGLGRAGARVSVAADGAAGIHAHHADPPDLVLLDVMLPGIPGMDVLARIRATRATPVILLSARATADDRRRGLAGGADDYIVKPFSLADVVGRIRHALSACGMPDACLPRLPGAPSAHPEPPLGPPPSPVPGNRATTRPPPPAPDPRFVVIDGDGVEGKRAARRRWLAVVLVPAVVAIAAPIAVAYHQPVADRLFGASSSPSVPTREAPGATTAAGRADAPAPRVAPAAFPAAPPDPTPSFPPAPRAPAVPPTSAPPPAPLPPTATPGPPGPRHATPPAPPAPPVAGPAPSGPPPPRASPPPRGDAPHGPAPGPREALR